MNYLEEKNVLIMLDLLNLHKHPPKKNKLIEKMIHVHNIIMNNLHDFHLVSLYTTD